MSFSPEHLSAIAYSGGFTLWHYRTNDQVKDLTTLRYFKPALGMLRSGDIMIVHAATPDSTAASVQLLTVTRTDRDSGVIELQPLRQETPTPADEGLSKPFSSAEPPMTQFPA